jgi:probable F420-dependent oxidoreductase
VKVRIGYGLGTAGMAGSLSGYAGLVDALEACGFDSLWLSERLSSPGPDPISALSFAAGRTRRLKLGTSVQVLPGRNPAVLAKEWATLDQLSGGRALPAFGLGVVDTTEQQAFGVAREERAAWFDEALPLLRQLWTGEPVDHHGPRFHYHGVRVLPASLQSPLDVWLGGRVASELRRVGRLGDGWLPSFCTPDDVAAGRVVVEAAAEAAGRAIDAEHWGALVPYTRGGSIPEPIATLLSRRRPDTDVAEVVATDLPALRVRLEGFMAVGFSKFVLIPLSEPSSWEAELEAVAGEILPLQRT